MSGGSSSSLLGGRGNRFRGDPAGGKFAPQLDNFILNRVPLFLQGLKCKFNKSLLVHLVHVTFPVGWGMAADLSRKPEA